MKQHILQRASEMANLQDLLKKNSELATLLAQKTTELATRDAARRGSALSRSELRSGTQVRFCLLAFAIVDANSR